MPSAMTSMNTRSSARAAPTGPMLAPAMPGIALKRVRDQRGAPGRMPRARWPRRPPCARRRPPLPRSTKRSIASSAPGSSGAMVIWRTTSLPASSSRSTTAWAWARRAPPGRARPCARREERALEMRTENRRVLSAMAARMTAMRGDRAFERLGDERADHRARCRARDARRAQRGCRRPSRRRRDRRRRGSECPGIRPYCSLDPLPGGLVVLRPPVIVPMLERGGRRVVEHHRDVRVELDRRAGHARRTGPSTAAASAWPCPRRTPAAPGAARAGSCRAPASRSGWARRRASRRTARCRRGCARRGS